MAQSPKNPCGFFRGPHRACCRRRRLKEGTEEGTTQEKQQRDETPSVKTSFCHLPRGGRLRKLLPPQAVPRLGSLLEGPIPQKSLRIFPGTPPGTLSPQATKGVRGGGGNAKVTAERRNSFRLASRATSLEREANLIPSASLHSLCAGCSHLRLPCGKGGEPPCGGGMVSLPLRSGKTPQNHTKTQKTLSFSVPFLYNILGRFCLRVIKEKVYE